MDPLSMLRNHYHHSTIDLLSYCDKLTDAQLDREFDLGLRTLRATLTDAVNTLRGWTAVMDGWDATFPPDPAPLSAVAIRERFTVAHTLFLHLFDRAIAANALNKELDDPPTDIPLHVSVAGGLVHVLTHGMVRRSEALHMLRALGVQPLSPLDIPTWENAARRVTGWEFDTPRPGDPIP